MLVQVHKEIDKTKNTSQLLISTYVNRGTVIHVRTVEPVHDHAQDTVGAVHNPLRQRRTLPRRGVEHPLQAAEPWQPHQHPECIFILNTQSIVLFLSKCNRLLV